MKLHFEEIVELIHREMYVRNGVMLGAKAAAKAIMQAEEAAEQSVHPTDGILCKDCGHSVEIKQVAGCLNHPVSG